jgi:hypothetical protein
MKTAVIAAAFTILGLIVLPAQDPKPTVTLTIEEIARRAQSRNLEIFKAARSVQKAREDLIGEPELIDSSLSVSSVYPFTRYRSSLTLPISPKLSVDAGASIALEDKKLQFFPGPEPEELLSLSVKPFAPKRHTYSEEKAYNLALVDERFLSRKIYLDAEQAALNLLMRDMERELTRATEELERKKYALAQRRQDLGEASFQDVQDQLVDLLEAREDLYDSEQRYLMDWKTLQLLFAPSEERIDVAPLSVDELLDLVVARREAAVRFTAVEPVTEKLQTLKLELVALQTELMVTPAWRPSLSLNLSASVAVPDINPGFGLSLSFSPNQFKGEERDELEEDIEVKEMEIVAETYAAQLQKSLEEQSIAIVEQALVSIQIQVERDRVALQEAELLFQQGQRTTLELEQLRLNLRRSEILTFQAAIEVYEALGDYTMLFLKP